MPFVGQVPDYSLYLYFWKTGTGSLRMVVHFLAALERTTFILLFFPKGLRSLSGKCL